MLTFPIHLSTTCFFFPLTNTTIYIEILRSCFGQSQLMAPHSSVGKESACNAGDPGSIPGSGKSPGEEIGYPLQCSWASTVARLVKNPPAMRETWVQFLGREDPWRRERLPTPVCWPGGFHGLYRPCGRKESAATGDCHFPV